MPRRNVKIFDNGGKRHIFDVDRAQAMDMLARGVAGKLSESPLTLRLAQPANSANDRRGLIQSRNPGKAKSIDAARRNENRGRGTLLRGGKSLGFENALVAVAAGTADAETKAALDAWKPNVKLVPTPSNADVVPERAILFFPRT